MGKRILVAVVCIPLIFVVFFCLPPICLPLMIALLSMIAIREALWSTGFVKDRRVSGLSILLGGIIPFWDFLGEDMPAALAVVFLYFVLLFAVAISSHYAVTLEQMGGSFFFALLVPYFLSSFVRLDGTFKQFCRSIVEKELETFCSGFRDLSAPEKRAKLKEYYDDNAVKKGTSQGEETVYYFLIDEINRADLSKVFGELMFGLEESYRGIENRFDTQYKNLKTYQVDPDTGIASPMAFDCFADGFFIPHNLHLIGTMNDIDRSVESFDFALRRRFRWIDVKANKIMESSLKAMGVPDPEDIARRASNMNCCLSESDFGLGEAYHIGPAYFKSMSAGEKLKEDLKEVFSHRIEPLLREYTRGQDAQDVEELIQKCKDTLLENKTQGGE